MIRVQKEIQQKLQLERQVLAVQTQKLNEKAPHEPVSTVEAQMHRKLQVRLASIERALSRIEKGTYGVCQSCGAEIDTARLLALPHAEQCIDCQHRLERRTVRPYTHTYAAY
jgi:RNA polymerase-binding protein DksA